MRRALVILILAACSSPAAGAASSAHCDAAPFTLGKPATTAAKAKSDQPRPMPQAVPATSKKPEAKPQGKQRLLANCKAGKATKKSS